MRIVAFVLGAVIAGFLGAAVATWLGVDDSSWSSVVIAVAGVAGGFGAERLAASRE